MAPPQILFAALIFVVGIPAALKNWTALGMVASWGIVTGCYLATGQSSSMLDLICDYVVLIAIFAKRREAHCPPFASGWHLLACVVTERSPCDRVVMLLFPAMWGLYGLPISPYYCWWGLWWLSVIQLLAAGWEGWRDLFASLSAAWSRWHQPPPEDGTPPRVMRLGLAGHE